MVSTPRTGTGNRLTDTIQRDSLRLYGCQDPRQQVHELVTVVGGAGRCLKQDAKHFGVCVLRFCNGAHSAAECVELVLKHRQRTIFRHRSTPSNVAVAPEKNSGQA
uniref:hypothetical protein n=1 Tax=Methylobacterium oryzae TaxID=334852 RepID=UPI00155D88E1|nr:hypothetical protein [Methylobacterium oryzae]